MAELPEEIERLAPQKLVASFAQSRALLCVGIAVVIHVVVIGMTSLDYIYYSWVNPEAGRAREEQARQAKVEPAPGGQLDQARAASPDGSGQTAPGANEGGAAAPGGADGQQPNAAQQATPVMERITRVPEPDEIPAEPDDLGIDIKDTNPF